jgi:hypothetical protein
MNNTGKEDLSVVEVRPEVVFLYELLDELTSGRLRIPRFQRPFVWRRDQMTDLLDSVYKQYPIGSLLVWETDVEVATLEHLGPFNFPRAAGKQVGYVLDGHQRLSTLAGALVARGEYVMNELEEDPGRWNLCWNMASQRFQHGRAEANPATLFPLTSLLDTLRFFSATDTARRAVAASDPSLADVYTAQVSEVARAFQYYRVPVIRMRQTELTEAVEIFARLNSKGQAMSADQMVSALMYRQGEDDRQFDLAAEIDLLVEQLGETGFGDVDRTTVLRAILANLDEDIYRTEWTRLARGRRDELLTKLRGGVAHTAESLNLAVNFLQAEGVQIGRLIPYAMQLVVLSGFFDAAPQPSSRHLDLLRKWFWVSSFSGWFGGANPSRVNALVAEMRKIARRPTPPIVLENFDLNASSLPFPSTFDMRSARTRVLLLVMLSLQPRMADGETITEPWRQIAEKGPSAVGHVFSDPPKDLTGNPANRMIRPPGAPRGLLFNWLRSIQPQDSHVMESHGVDKASFTALQQKNAGDFIRARQAHLIQREHEFQARVGVEPSSVTIAAAPIDTD